MSTLLRYFTICHDPELVNSIFYLISFIGYGLHKQVDLEFDDSDLRQLESAGSWHVVNKYNYSPGTYHIKHNIPGSVVKQFLRGGVCELYPTFCLLQCYLR
jgi:hypothetical protein